MNENSPAQLAKNNNRAVKVLIILGCAGLIALVFLFVITSQGNISGSEFSPSHFQQRDFQFYEIPLLHLQITPIRRTSSTPDLASYLRQKSLIQAPPAGLPDDWQLVSISRGISGTTSADPYLLMEQFGLRQDDELFWKNWTDNHPKLAAVLWPRIQNLARRELYILMPELFEMIQLDQSATSGAPPIDSPTGLGERIDQYLVQQYLELIDDMVAADRIELARQLAEEALQDYPEAADWLDLIPVQIVESPP